MKLTTDRHEEEVLAALATRLHETGPRVIYEFLVAIHHGGDFLETVEDFSRIDPAVYAAICARLSVGGLA
jgi:hypothetical protein